MLDKITHNVIIIGSGPAGLTAALYAARADLKPLVIAGLEPGGQLMQTTEVENFPGFVNGIMGPELMDNMIKQVERFGTKLVRDNAVAVDFSKKPFAVKTSSEEFLANSVIIATGATANWLGLPNEQRLRGKGVSACATCDGFFFKDKDIVVAGGGDSAMEEANFLTKFGKSVTIVHRREDFKASKIMLARARANSKIKFVTNVAITDIIGEEKVEGVKIKHNQSGQEEVLSAQGFFVAIGHTPTTKIFKEAGIETDEKGYVKVFNHTHTNTEGVFVAGDVNDPRYRQAISAAGMGCMAALDVEKYLAEQEGH
ncbi:MAG: thioredoxin-disulfide reductase [Candidatus Doudnabacteria bacterium]|nr:thioredoxin-disulfide reductase [Candidatus Doudnabacteria bacterium]